MTNEINLDGDGNIVVQDSERINITVNNILLKSHDYNTMLNELSYQQEMFIGIAEDKVSLRLKVSEKINELTNRIEQFKREIVQLAETFDKLEVNSERLRQAREFFEKGEIGEARALLNDDNERIAAEEEQLWRKRDYYETEIEPKLIAKSEERLIQALLSQTDYANPNWFAETCNYFELSTKSYLTKDNLFRHALFLQKHNQFADAEKYYSKYLNDFSAQISKNEYAAALNNLAILHKAQNRFDEALNEYEEALALRRQLAETNPNTYLPFVATTLNNLANLHKAQNRYDEALNEYEEALTLYRQLAETNPHTFLPFVATTLNNLAVLHKAQNRYDEALREYEEALTLYRQLAETNPNTYLPDVAMTLNNLAILHQAQNRFDEALREYEEALALRRQLAETNPNTYLPDVAMTLNNLANLHSDQNRFDEALNEYEEALTLYRQLAETNPHTYLPNVAMTLNNLAIWFAEQKELDKALDKFEESTNIYRELAVNNFQAYFPFLANNLSNLALFYQKEKNAREISIEYAIETIIILLPYVENVPFTQQYYVSAWKILNDWNLSDEEIDRMIAERIKANE